MTKPDRVQLWSCGGGRQSAGIAAFIVQGRLPKPDHVCMAALEWERRETFKYVNNYIRPAMRSLGVPFTFVSRKKYATVDLWSGADERSTVLPVYSNKSGKMSKLSEYCSGEWKREVTKRWANEQGRNRWPNLTHESPEWEWKKRGVDNWIGISHDEKHRRRNSRTQWLQVKYPLLDMMGRSVHVSGCLQAVEDVGWPEPPRSRCCHCPNQSDREWLELTPGELERACKLEEHVQSIDPHAFFHKSLKPLRMVTFDASDKTGKGGCTAGMCF